MAQKEFYKAEEVAQELRIPLRKVYYLRKRGVIQGEIRLRGSLSNAKIWQVSRKELDMLKKELQDA